MQLKQTFYGRTEGTSHSVTASPMFYVTHYMVKRRLGTMNTVDG